MAHFMLAAALCASQQQNIQQIMLIKVEESINMHAGNNSQCLTAAEHPPNNANIKTQKQQTCWHQLSAPVLITVHNANKWTKLLAAA